MSNVDMLIELCETMHLPLDINYIRGYVKVKNKTFKSIDDALAHVKARDELIRSF